ncbi:MAG: Fmu (Sun) domain-containing protein [Chitinophagaceae bacterium]
MKYFSHLNTAVKILGSYKGQQPFVIFLKEFFSRDKKYGSKDRKQIAQLCYCYFRLGKAGRGLLPEDRILTAYFLCAKGSDELLQHLKPAWNEFQSMTAAQKLVALHLPFSLEDIFPWQEELSDSIDHHDFCQSFLIQPDLFLRIRPGKEKNVLLKLDNAGIDYQQLAPDCIAVANSTKIEAVIEVNKEAVVQDYSSQQTGKFLQHLQPILKKKPSVWDCCAASGGKSILANDVLGNIDLTVSDIRESILSNLKKRFNEAGIRNYKSILADLYSQPDSHRVDSHNEKYDLIIADVPCTGSGTWGRTPEQLLYFEKEKINEYADRQEKIISNVIPSVKPGGYLLYITCSVFKKENEDRVDFIKQKFSLAFIMMDVLKGYDKKADTLFAALLRKPDAPIP